MKRLTILAVGITVGAAIGFLAGDLISNGIRCPHCGCD